jgi:putative membrane protein
MEWPPRSLEMVLYWFLYTAAYGLLGIGLVVLGFKIFDWLTPRIDIQKELGEKHNVAVAILCAAIILGISLMVAAVIHG